ncbi:MAG: EcsC family protein [Ruminococcaceae bacterium]|nr:EcsC family protein [Oscillospiraceae bacterium]
MIIKSTRRSLEDSIYKELKSVSKHEEKCRKKAREKDSSYKEKLQKKIPEGLNHTLQNAFSKAFGLIFKHGIEIIEKTYNKDNITAESDIQKFAIDRIGNRREIRKLRRTAEKSDFLNLSITTVEGIGLGALGIGLPDVVLFLGMVLKGIYEVSLRYGYDYELPSEKYFILKLMGTALSKNEEWEKRNGELDKMLQALPQVNETAIELEIEETSGLFATDMLVLKFIQGIPVIGMVGGVFNPIYYKKILNYVQLKYYKRYLKDKLRTLS